MQNARKTAGLQVEDRIELALDGDAARCSTRPQTHRDYIAGETLAHDLDLSERAAQEATRMDYSEQTEIDGLPLSISLSRAQRAG